MLREKKCYTRKKNQGKKETFAIYLFISLPDVISQFFLSPLSPSSIMILLKCKLWLIVLLKWHVSVHSKSWLPAKSELHEKTRGLSLEETTDETRAVAAKLVSQDVSGETPLVMPIYHSSTYRIPSVESYCKILDQVNRSPHLASDCCYDVIITIVIIVWRL